MSYKVYTNKQPFPHLVVTDMYDEVELKLIWEELVFLTKPEKFIKDNYGTGIDDVTKAPKSLSKAVMLDEVYSKREISSILSLNLKTVSQEILTKFAGMAPMCKSILAQNQYLTKIRYYENNDEYLPHVDNYNYTAITFFYKEPKAFEGGDLVFTEHNYNFGCKNNSMILFPSCIEHAATRVTMTDNSPCNGNGRYTMMQFMRMV